jgi:hypothetical protein
MRSCVEVMGAEALPELKRLYRAEAATALRASVDMFLVQRDHNMYKYQNAF